MLVDDCFCVDPVIITYLTVHSFILANVKWYRGRRAGEIPQLLNLSGMEWMGMDPDPWKSKAE